MSFLTYIDVLLTVCMRFKRALISYCYLSAASRNVQFGQHSESGRDTGLPLQETYKTLRPRRRCCYRRWGMGISICNKCNRGRDQKWVKGIIQLWAGPSKILQYLCKSKKTSILVVCIFRHVKILITRQCQIGCLQYF